MRSRYHAIVVEKLAEFYELEVPAVFERDLSLGAVQEPRRSNLVNVIVGVRRCGKTYRLYQEMHRILRMGYDLASILYFNFDDERLKPYETTVLDDVVESFYARNPQAKTTGAFFFFDEIQEVPDWGAFMRRMVDTQPATIYVTGSSSKMLSLQLASEFRGRALSRELFPMSFAEYVRYHDYGVALPDSGTDARTLAFTESDRAKLRNALGSYLRQGGFIPAQSLDSSDATQLLQEYANRTVNYDIIERYAVPNPRAAAVFLARCMASSARELSMSKAHNEFKSRGISMSRETMAQLLSYYEESYLLFTVKNTTVALADNARSPAKVYAADPALFSAFSPAPSTDEGQKLETTVFDKLRRNPPSARSGAIARAFVGDGPSRQEIDFVIGDALAFEPVQLVQVSTSLEDPRTRKRELSALEKAMERFNAEQSWIVTLDEEDSYETAHGVVNIVPAWKWLL